MIQSEPEEETMNVHEHHGLAAAACPQCAQEFRPIYFRLIAFFVLECVIAFLLVLL
jgi:hypothetical protein